MKFTFFIAFILVLKTSSSAQEDSIAKSQYTWQVISGLGLEHCMRDYTSTNSLAYGNSKHFFSLGHIFSINTWNERKNGGAEFNYQYYPNTNAKRFCLFFFNRTFLFFDKRTGTNTYTNLLWTPQSDQQSRISKYKYLESFLGYGIRLNLGKYFYLFQANAVGVSFQGSDVKSTFAAHPENNWHYKQGLFDDSYEFGYSLQLGLGFIFKGKQPSPLDLE